ncbi:MAG: hypothetical protein KDE04_27140, partial [Anaerolineales bacterium]|nr:hypothetical protein [Anaerolineales bacterium]
MALEGRHWPLTSGAVAWGWQLLGERAGADWEGLNLDLVYGASPAKVERPTVCIAPAAPESWRNLVPKTEASLDWLPAAAVLPAGERLPIGDQLPILCWGDGATRAQFATLISERVCQIHADILGAAVFMVSRWEETVSDSLDEHGRFPASASAAWRHRFL